MFVPHDMAVDIATCVERDSKRVAGVGKAVVHRMALQNGMIDWEERPIVLCDIDGRWQTAGTVNISSREKKDWDSYYSLLQDDLPIDAVVRWVRELHKDHTVCLVSGRPDTYQLKTMIWLMSNSIPIMRCSCVAAVTSGPTCRSREIFSSIYRKRRLLLQLTTARA